MDDKKTKFETDLKAFFPDLADLNDRSKADDRFWDVINEMTEFISKKRFGHIEIYFQAGVINSIVVTHKKERKLEKVPYHGEFDKNT